MVRRFASFLRLTRPVFAVAQIMREENLVDLLSHLHDGVERGERVLKDHRHVLAAHFLHLLVGEVLDVRAAQFEFIHPHDGGRGGKQFHHGERGNALAASRFTPDGGAFTLLELDIDALHRAHDPHLRGEDHF